MEALRTFLITVAQLGDENPQIKGAAITSAFAVASAAFLKWSFSFLRKKPVKHEDDRVKIDAPASANVSLSISQRREEK